MGRVIKWWLFFIVGFYLCGVLTSLPLIQAAEWYRPLWVLMFVIFCQLSQPQLFNPIVAWCMGLLLDALQGTQLGQQALIMASVSYITMILRPKFLMRPFWQQIGKVFWLVCLGQILNLWFHALDGQNPQTLLYWMGSVTSCLIWPVFFFFSQLLTRFLSVPAYSMRRL
ncbi:rod shape-determining protein MreD [Candidatus Berkiella aquae]|uniref:Rod shape-determining protein MreD n=1 Tax=Candidatus Berkiella aquae TaxID=295108 RepID=A0A0Q9YJB1_9GAMM|nr:rod shape-determining protein MreD [Candidatus Berkiella aquae]MCS5710711.1 rod shape-determining protein MreD [Candidatus Berkiella aquae]